MTTTLPLLDDARAVLEATLHTYVGNRAGRDELVRILRRIDDEALERQEQLTAERDRWGVPLALRADCLEDSRAVDEFCGF